MKTNHTMALDCLDRADNARECHDDISAAYWVARAQVYATLAQLDR